MSRRKGAWNPNDVWCGASATDLERICYQVQYSPNKVMILIKDSCYTVKSREFYGSTEGTYGTINIRSKEGACGFLPRIVNYNPFALIKVNEETGEVVRGKDGLCITCQPGEAGEMVGLVRVGDRGGPGKFQAYVDKQDPNKGKIIKDVWKKGDMCFR